MYCLKKYVLYKNFIFLSISVFNTECLSNIIYLSVDKDRELSSTDMKKSKVFNQFFALIFTGSQSFYASRVSEPLGGCWWSKVPHIARAK